MRVFGLVLSFGMLSAGAAWAEPCQTLDELRADQDARYLAGAVRGCVADERYVDAVQTFWAYSNFALFDQQRVRDESAHVAVQELHGWIFSGYSFAIIGELKKVIAELRDPDGVFLATTCRGVAKAGPPEYRPTYMIKRGMIPRKTEDDWKVAGFDADAAWQKALVEINGCPVGVVAER